MGSCSCRWCWPNSVCGRQKPNCNLCLNLAPADAHTDHPCSHPESFSQPVCPQPTHRMWEDEESEVIVVDSDEDPISRNHPKCGDAAELCNRYRDHC